MTASTRRLPSLPLWRTPLACRLVLLPLVAGAVAAVARDGLGTWTAPRAEGGRLVGQRPHEGLSAWPSAVAVVSCPAPALPTVWIGVCASAQASGSELERLLALADEALYAAEDAGRDRVALHRHREAPVERVPLPRREGPVRQRA